MKRVIYREDAFSDQTLGMHNGAAGPLLKELRDQFNITAHPQNAAHARERVRTLAAQAGFSGMDLTDIEIAVGEAVTNAILYGSPNAASHIAIIISLADCTFHVEIRDQGHGFDPDRVRAANDSDALGGRGIQLMRALMDQVHLYFGDQGMIARLSKNVAR